MAQGKKFSVSSVVPEKRLDYLESVFADMKAKMHQTVKGGLLLAGDPGVGKTSFVRQLAQLAGIKLVLIETPHLVEEHIINIPFIVYHPESNTSTEGKIEAHKAKFDVKLADSDLYNQVMHSKIVPESQVLASIKRSPAIKHLHEALGGTDDTFSEEVQELREHFNCILFLDEYYRETSMSIRNILRGILNGNLGLHQLPKTCYVVYASNMNDEGVEGIALNQDYSKLEFDNPGKAEWFSWFVKKFQDNPRVKLNMQLVDKFFDALDDADLSHDDANADVRTSPRRWEQLLLLINASMPVKSEKDAKVLMSQVHTNFRNYTTGAKSQLAQKVATAVAELIKDQSGIEVESSWSVGGGQKGLHPVEHWRDVLKHQLEVKMKLAEHRSYVPVISGLPGIGKTSHIIDVALELGLVPVMIPTDTLSPEDIIGLPLSDENEKGSLSVKFSEPGLYKIIKNKIKEGEGWLKEHLKEYHLGSQEHGAGAKRSEGSDPDIDWKEFEGREHKYLIFFDELNRTSTKVFNALRRILLDKTFVGEPGHEGSLELPKGSIVVAAINPNDQGTTELTKHMRDVLDIIPAGASWNQTVTFLKTKTEPKLAKVLKNPEIAKAVFEITSAFYDKFKDARNEGKHDGDNTEFHLNLGSSNIYVSPREFEDMYSGVCHNMDPKVSRFKREAHDTDDAAAVDKMAHKLKQKVYEAFKQKLSFIIEDKHGIRSPDFWNDLEEWFMTAPEADRLDLISKKAKVMTFEDIAEKTFRDTDFVLANNIAFTNYIQNIDPGIFKQDLNEFLSNRGAHDQKFLIDATHLMRELADDKITIKHIANGPKVSHFEYFLRELVHAIMIHGLSREFIPPLKEALLTFLGSDAISDDEYDALGDINQRMTKYIKQLLSKGVK
jgi:MoxR-like ATPase